MERVMDWELAMKRKYQGYRSFNALYFRTGHNRSGFDPKGPKSRLLAGGSHITGLRLLRCLAEKQKIPVTTTLMGMGAFPSTHYLSLGMLGMHGTRYANYAIGECDLLIGIGVRFDDRVTSKIEAFAPHAKVIHIDIDAAEIARNVDVDETDSRRCP
jgi:acetolactate synthase-1/2/3 large subunit